ncbi:unnamed protein product, partial [Didymodactylos carnosus]
FKLRKMSGINVEKPDRPELAKHDSSILDLAFAMDCTGSMGSYIASATQNIRSIVEEIVISEKSDIRLALVEYRDHPPQDTSFVTRVHDFTTRVSEMKGWLEQCSAQGGGDTPEAVADALHDILKLNWREEATKICILISDAPPHGLHTSGDTFPNGCPNGLDPIKTVREMAEKSITLYAVGVEPPIVPYRDFFMSIAYITGGQYVPMQNAKLLAQVIIGGVREEISIDKLMQDAQHDIDKEMEKAELDGVDEREKATRINRIFALKNMKVKQIKNPTAMSSIAKECYSKCSDMDDLKRNYKMESSPTIQTLSKSYGKSDVMEPSAAAGGGYGGLLSSVTGWFKSGKKESDDILPTTSSVDTMNTATADLTYDLKEEEDVSIEQAERIVQKWQNRK